MEIRKLGGVRFSGGGIRKLGCLGEIYSIQDKDSQTDSFISRSFRFMNVINTITVNYNW